MTIPTKRRVVVTGMGAVTNVGLDAPSMWRSLVEGRSGIDTIRCFQQNEQWTVRIAGEVRDWDPRGVLEHSEVKRTDRFCSLGVCAADEAARDSGIDFKNGDPYSRGVVIGSGIGGILTIEEGYTRLLQGGPRKMSPFTVPKLMVNACAGNVSIRHNLRGVNSCTATACATGGHAIGHAFQFIQRGDAEVIVAGGTEAAISPLCIGSFSAMKALSTRNDEPTRASRPFDRDRDGFVLAEGAAIMILEELEHAKKRRAKIYAEMLGFGTSGDANHIAAPDADGTGARCAMQRALDEARVNLDQIDYINAHGTSTPLGDAAEVVAVKALFGHHAKKLAMSSTKSMTGHALGAAGGIESLAVALAVHYGVMPPTINLEHPDDGFDLNFVPNRAQQSRVRYGLNNSFGFGGHNVSLCFGQYRGD
ncbi:MAG: beta-ketoacyl-ACP synthase II [Phycisphaerales bacterium]|nr:beta-ketoacyl-ACP synthase II [Phycisphaerales bacterium]MCI0632243.1 beta-ketoacyl-ACP synthase II [Phycisphaerales bacterium]MCI0676274.1 beta-ketoacyl-ACP synthase II [Phycisphaerales bacterium]